MWRRLIPLMCGPIVPGEKHVIRTDARVRTSIPVTSNFDRFLSVPF
jgi:hypothetical protein